MMLKASGRYTNSRRDFGSPPQKTVVEILQTLEPSKVKNTKPLEERTNGEELVKKVLEEVGEDLHHKELVENLTEEDEEAVPLLWGYGSSYEGMLSPFPRTTQKIKSS